MGARKDFPYLRNHPDLIYLDSAATAHKPDCVIEAISRFYAEDYATVHRSAYRQSFHATELYHLSREAARQFLNARSTDEIVFTRGTTDAINLVARTFPFEEGDEIVVSKLEHHSNLLPWQMVAKEKKLTLRWIDLQEDGTLDLRRLPFTKKTKLVAITHVSNVTGAITPLEEIVRQAKSIGATVLVDGAQAAVHLPIDVQALDVDFYAFSGHKCYGPTGIGVLYGKKDRLMEMLPLQGGGGMVQTVEMEESSYELPPLRFEAGTPMSAPAIGLKAALEYIRQKDASHEADLLAFATKELLQIEGLRILGSQSTDKKVPLLSFSIEQIHPLDLASFLDTKGIAIRSGHLCAQPLMRFFGLEHAARASFALYNTKEEASFFVEAVRAASHILR